MFNFRVLSIENGKNVLKFIWDILLFRRRFFQGNFKDVSVPSTYVLEMNSPIIDGELFVDGEVFIE